MNKSFVQTLIRNELAIKFHYSRKRAEEISLSLVQTFSDAGWLKDQGEQGEKEPKVKAA